MGHAGRDPRILNSISDNDGC